MLFRVKDYSVTTYSCYQKIIKVRVIDRKTETTVTFGQVIPYPIN
ncbi:hypothetical protein H1P_600024 [Hyella patelloides LEGE 07179]|uniref:Transposase n=1 Tax=Hyella patelloides LEGE 07179 TaxID=945734 RepID=A0A563W1M2_9CYAN|nr:hypothetical protein H1P_600024 [Hyella patelloides LEGE 07179]